jgi:hypothetical protein
MAISLLKPEPAPTQSHGDFRSQPLTVEFKADPDLVVRLRGMDSRTPFARGIVMEAAAEIERLRDAIRLHRQQVWGEDAPDHASDTELYKAVAPQ